MESEEPMETEESSRNDEKDILDSSVFGVNAKLLECVICNQKFTNKLKITIHWSINHGYKLCNLCTNYAFKYDTDRLHHERQHLPFGCSSCEHEFNSVSHDTISEHYKKEHQSFLCMYCSSVIEPYNKFPEHIEKKHNVGNYGEFVATKSVLYEIIGDPESGFFHCKMCNKKKRINLLFGHFAFYHNLSIQALRDSLEMEPNLKINGSSLNGADNEAETENSVDVCNVCKKPCVDDSSVHGVFCKGYVICNQKECDQLFEDKKALAKHLDFEHPTSSCKFGCSETNLKAREVDEHLQKLHDIVECNLCNIINSSGNLKNHLRDKHSVNLMTYEKAQSQTTSKLYRVEGSQRQKRVVLCNFCDLDLTTAIREFSFISHYQEQHEIHITAILRNLDKNPIIDVMMKENSKATDDECFKNFQIVLESSLEELIESDFDTSKVYCIGSDEHLEQKPQIDENSASKISCEFCNKTTFDASCRLYEHMTESHGFKLLNVDKECGHCHITSDKPKESEEDSKNFNLSLVCPFDESLHVTKDNFKAHMAFEHSDSTLQVDKIIYKCFECNFGYPTLNEMREHFQKVHPDIKMNYCRICRFRLNHNDSNHFKFNHADNIKQVEKYLCKLCKKSFKAKNKAKTHYENFHKKKEAKKAGAFKCMFNLCSEAFENKEDRKMHHMIVHPDEKMFACKNCPLKFSTKSSLSSHNLIHKNVINTCEFCSKQFIRRDSYKEHLLIHSGVRQKCSFCEKTFVQRSNLVRHERIHLNDKPYKCSYCDKTFSDKGACTSHEKVHTKSEHSNCEVCGKHFARKQKLKYHMRIHTLENVLTCECGKIFTESYSFRKHQETHMKKSRNECEQCGKTFKSAKAKGEHMITEHNVDFPEAESLIETKIQCTLCNLKDFTMDTIKEHLTTVHNVDESNNWESFVGEVEFEMDISEETMA